MQNQFLRFFRNVAKFEKTWIKIKINQNNYIEKLDYSIISEV